MLVKLICPPRDSWSNGLTKNHFVNQVNPLDGNDHFGQPASKNLGLGCGLLPILLQEGQGPAEFSSNPG